MKLYFAFLVLCGAALAAIVSATLIYHHHQATVLPVTSNQVFEVKGLIRSFEADGKTVHIAHEDIPGFMPAMEMPFTVKNPSVLRGLATGNAVKFQLVVTKDDSWITRIEKLPATPAAAATAEASSFAVPQQVDVGQPVPDFVLIDQNGRPFRLQELRGKAVVLTFIYTRCPLPNYCPLMSRNFASLQERFAKDFPGKVQLLSISFDPRFDTPATLKQYATLFQKDDRGWTFATGSPEQIDFVTRRFGLIQEPSNGFINHDLRTALIGPDGKLVHVWRSNVWTPYEVERMVRETLESQVATSSQSPRR
jgi:protein SCO1